MWVTPSICALGVCVWDVGHVCTICKGSMEEEALQWGDQEPACAGAGGDGARVAWGGAGSLGRGLREGHRGWLVLTGEMREGASAEASWGECLHRVPEGVCVGRASARQGCSMTISAGRRV